MRPTSPAPPPRCGQPRRRHHRAVPTMRAPLFTGANVAGLTITGTNLSEVQNLATTQLTTTNRNWTGARLPYYAPLSKCAISSGGYNLKHTSFESLNLYNAVFDGLALNGTNFTKARLDWPISNTPTSQVPNTAPSMPEVCPGSWHPRPRRQGGGRSASGNWLSPSHGGLGRGRCRPRCRRLGRRHEQRQSPPR